tara:strand:- start:598 stop:1173 length:576 start_codon:yes stop_codon:yes gene_type:complete
MLQDLTTGSQTGEIPLSEVITGLKNRVLGCIMLLFALPCVMPMPPGVPAIAGLVLLSCGIHLAIGRESLWMPSAFSRQTISRKTLESIIARAVPVARRIERLCQPRWEWATSRLGRIGIGATVIVLALILILPIPFLGNLPPGIAIAILALGIIERDGVVIILGMFASAIALAITSAMAWAAAEGLLFLVQ